MTHPHRRLIAAVALCGSLAGCYGTPVAPAPVAYAPAPDPAASAVVTPQPIPVVYGTTCYAGFYVCRLTSSGPVGAPCQCPGLGAPSFGSIR